MIGKIVVSRISPKQAAVVALCVSLAGCAPPDAEALKRGDITLALSGGLDRLDPGRTANGTDLQVVAQIYETLLKMGADGNLEPNIATSYEAVKPNTWRFRLRRDVKFQDGTPLTASDVQFSILRILDRSLASPHAAQLSGVRQVNIVDEHTVDIVSASPDPQLPRRMQAYGGGGRVFIVSKKYVEANTPEVVAGAPMGSGPYRLAKWIKGQKVILEANPNYWGPAPNVTRASIVFIPENSTRVNALLRKDVDLIERVPPSDVERIRHRGDLHVMWTPNGLVQTIALDCGRPPFNDIEVRKAFTESIDLPRIVEGLLGDYGRVLPGPLPPQVVQYDPSLAPRQYNPVSARAIVGRKHLPPLATYTSYGRYVSDREIYQVVNAQAGAAGFQIRPRTMEWGRMISMMGAGTAGPFYIVGWDFSENDASKMDGFANSSRPTARCIVPAYDAAAREALVELDDAKRTQLWRKAQLALRDSYTIAGAWQAASIFAGRKEIQWKPTFGDNIALADIRITSQSRPAQ